MSDTTQARQKESRKSPDWLRALSDLLTGWRDAYLREYAEARAAAHKMSMQNWGHLAGGASILKGGGKTWEWILQYFDDSPFAATAVRLHDAFAERGRQDLANWTNAVVHKNYEGKPPASTPLGETVALRAVLHALDWLPGYEPYPCDPCPYFNAKEMREWPAADRRRMEGMHWKAFRLAQARLDALEAEGSPMTVGRVRPPLSKEEREVLVRDYLGAHKARAAKGEVGIREVSDETGVPVSSVHGTAAWTALQERLDRLGRSRRPRKRKAQAFTAKMDGAVEDTQLQVLVREQAADDEGSPLDKGRRGNVRVRKKV